MKFFLDHDVPDDIGRLLEAEGHQATHVRDVLTIRTPDPDVLEYAWSHELLLITCNRDDFIDLIKSESHCGIIILIRRASRHSECAHLLRLIQRAGEEGLTGNVNFA